MKRLLAYLFIILGFGLLDGCVDYTPFFHIFLNVDLVSVYAITITSRGVAQPGSASGLGPEGRRFKSFRPDH